jgi:dTDP-4-amino-4,6-dideoxygalactose transaminase
MRIPFNKPYMTGKELWYISQAHANGHLAGDGEFTRRCNAWLERRVGCNKALLTHSCTAALEMTAILADLEPGDEVIMPSYTFVSTANAFVLRGAKIVFVDIREDTLNLDETMIETAITDKTKAIVAVHYAGVSCEMDTINQIAKKHGLSVIEDAAQGILATYKGRPLGSIGDFAAYSFHETKNVISGEGGCLLINNGKFSLDAEIIREKGTDRSQYFRGEVDRYTWQKLGSSFLPGELIAAFLWAQLEEAKVITQRRLDLWDYYHEQLAVVEKTGIIRRPIIPEHCQHNAHMYYVLLSPGTDRSSVLKQLDERGVNAVFHYVPLHSSPAGKHFGRAASDLSRTTDLSERLIRLPLWVGMTKEIQDQVITALKDVLNDG